MAISKAKKQELLTELVDKFKNAKSGVFAGFGSTNITEQDELRNTLRKGKGELKIAKKTIIKIALKEAGIAGEVSDADFTGEIAIALSYEDPTFGAQTVKKLGKKIPNLSLRCGFFEGKLLNQSEVKELADLPSKEVLIAKLMGSMLAPISGFASVGSNTIAGFVRVIDKHQQNLAQQG